MVILFWGFLFDHMTDRNDHLIISKSANFESYLWALQKVAQGWDKGGTWGRTERTESYGRNRTPRVRLDVIILEYWMWKLTTLMERAKTEIRIQRVALVCKPHLSSSAILHFPAFPNVPVWSFTIRRLPPTAPPQHYPPWIPTSCFICCIPRRWRRHHMWNRRRESSFENWREGRQQSLRLWH